MQLVERAGVFYADSRDVADMVDKRHDNLLRDIEGYKAVLDQSSNLRTADFFIESSYVSAGREYKSFLLTRRGCDMVANKMTGDKGVLFTAAYVSRFEEMERAAKADISQLSPILQALIQTEQRQLAIEARQQRSDEQIAVIKETFLQRDERWRDQMNGMLNAAAKRTNGDFRQTRTESYRRLEQRAHCDLNRRLSNMRVRLQEDGATKTKIETTNRLDVIESEPRLKEIYTGIVKELSIGTIL